MTYNLTEPYQYDQYKRRCNYLAKKKRLVEIIDKSTRSLDQNSYLYLLISYFASETGNTIETVKEIYFKIEANYEIFYDKRKSPRSTASLNIEEMSLAIERFKIWASINADIFLPDAENNGALREMQCEVKRNKKYL